MRKVLFYAGVVILAGLFASLALTGLVSQP